VKLHVLKQNKPNLLIGKFVNGKALVMGAVLKQICNLKTEVGYL